jgi:transposase
MGRACCRKLLAENRQLRRENAALRRRVATLEKAVATLQVALEASQRQGKRQAAPFSEGAPKDKPKRPGRKRGKRYGKRARLHPPPEDQIDQVHRAKLPEACPHCGCPSVQHTHDAVQYQIELPRKPIWRRFDIELGHCCGCHKPLQGRHELQTSRAVGAAGVMLGAHAQAAAAFLNKKCGLSHGKVCWVFRELFRIPLSRGGSSQVVSRVARKCDPTYQQILESVRGSPRVRADETGWRIAGRLGWMHALVGDEATCYLIRPSRAADVTAEALTWDYSGMLLHDGWSAYGNFTDAVHAQCAAHPLARAHRMLETVRGMAARFPRQVIDLFKAALQRRDRLNARNVSEDSAARFHWYCHFSERLTELVSRPKLHAGNERFACHLENHLSEWFVFLLDPRLEAANWPAEQAVRQGVVNRKVWGGNRTLNGAHAQETLMSIMTTCRQQSRNALDYLVCLLQGKRTTLLNGK